MDSEHKVNAWVETVTARNDAEAAVWSARFVIDNYWPVDGAIEDLATVGGAIRPDGDMQYVVTFARTQVREALQIVAEQNGWLCERQTVAPAAPGDS